MRAIDADALEKEGWSLHRDIQVDKTTREYQTMRLSDVPDIYVGECEDTISRQAAKEWLAKWEGYIDRDMIARMQCRVIDIPSAQPEPKWIPCSERLPEVGQDVMLSVGGIYSAEGCLRDDGDWWQFRWDSVLRKDMVSAWMPLPESYTGGNQMKEICKNCADCKPTYKGGYCDRKNKKVKQSDTCYEWRPKK